MTDTPLPTIENRADAATLPFTSDERKAFVDICFTAMRLNDEFKTARVRLSFDDLRKMSDALANLMLRWASERAPRKDTAEVIAYKEALRASSSQNAALPAEVEIMREALNGILTAETFDLHVGYDEGGNYIYTPAIRTDHPAFVRARAIASAPQSTHEEGEP